MTRPRLLEAWRRQPQARVISALVASVPPRGKHIWTRADHLLPGDRIDVDGCVVTLTHADLLKKANPFTAQEPLGELVFLRWGGLSDCQFVSADTEFELVR